MTLIVTPWDGEPIHKPGIYKNVPMEAYHGDLCAGPSLSKSGAKTIFFSSPAHYFDASYLNPHREEPKDSEALLFGRAAHHLLLGEAAFDRHFIIRPTELNGAAWNSHRTDCKAWLAMAREQGLTVLLPAQIEAIRGMARGLQQNPIVRAGVLNGLVEHSFVWQDRATGVWLKWRPDAVPTDSLDFGDLKSAADISDDGIETAISRDGLNMQGGLGAMACREVLGREMNSFTCVFSEKARPFCARAKTLKPTDIELGEKQMRIAIDTFARCIERGVWPGPGGEQSDAEYAEIKPWARTRIEHRIAIMEQELAA